MKVLLLLDEIWNDDLFANNNMTNWFTGFDRIELAVICCSEGRPYNKCCSRYFQVTDRMMIDSILKGKPAGCSLKEENYGVRPSEVTPVCSGGGMMAWIRSTHWGIFHLARDFVWLKGKYNIDALGLFLDDFAPDVIFSQRRASVKMCRLEEVVYSLCKAPMVAFTGDNEMDDGVPAISPVFYLRRAMLKRTLERNMCIYSHYYTSSEEQARLYTDKYGVATSLAFKCAVPKWEDVHSEIHRPIRFLYVGKLYCGRWKTLAALANALREINQGEVKAVLDIYTRDDLTKRQWGVLHDGHSSFVRGPIKPQDIQAEYETSDVVLHVESFDRKNRAITRYSYSTKVIDCLSSGCAVMVIGWENHSACIELKKDDAAVVITSEKEIVEAVKNLTENPGKILTYAKKAMTNIVEAHSAERIQETFYRDFSAIINEDSLCLHT